MRLDSPLFDKHLIHVPQTSHGELPRSLAQFLESKGDGLTSWLLTEGNSSSYVRDATAVELINDAEGRTYLVAKYLRPPFTLTNRARLYTSYLTTVTTILTALDRRLQDGDIPDGDRHCLRLWGQLTIGLGGADLRFGEDMGAAIPAMGRRVHTLQRQSVLDEEQLRQLGDLLGGTIVLFTNHNEVADISAEWVALDDPRLTDGGYRISQAFDSKITFVGPGTLTSDHVPLGERFGRAVIDKSWFDADHSDLIRDIRQFGGSLMQGSCPADDYGRPLLPFLFSRDGGHYRWLPIDAHAPGLFDALLATYSPRLIPLASRAHVTVQDLVWGLLPALAKDALTQRARTWLASRDTGRIERLEVDLNQAREQARHMQSRSIIEFRKAQNIAQELAVVRANPHTVDETELAGLQRMFETGLLTHFTPTPDVGPEAFKFRTRTLYAKDDRSRAWHELGEYEVSVNMSPRQDHDPAVRFINLTRQIDGYSNDMQHPHVWSGGDACEGNFVEVQTDLLLNRDWLSLVQMSIAFLESVNVNDPAGASVYRWPFVQDPASVGLPAYEGRVHPWYQDDEDGDFDGEPYYDERGFDADGLHVDTGTPYNDEGYDANGYNRDGWDEDGYHRETGDLFDPHGYDLDGYDEQGFTAVGIHANGTRYDDDGYDAAGYNSEGIDRYGEPREDVLA